MARKAKAVPVHQVHGVLLAGSGGVLAFEEHLGHSAILRREIVDGFEHVLVLLAEALGDLPAGCHRLAVLGG